MEPLGWATGTVLSPKGNIESTGIFRGWLRNILRGTDTARGRVYTPEEDSCLEIVGRIAVEWP